MSPQSARNLAKRRAGVLLPLNALCSDTDGALGERARGFLDFLAGAGFGVWQMLPIHPADEYGSPYQSCSVHAGDPRLISAALLHSAGWMAGMPRAAGVEPAAAALDAFERNAAPEQRADYAEFRRRTTAWLDDYALYAALRLACGGRPWWQWPPALRDRDGAALAAFRAEHGRIIEQQCFEQYLFASQWRELRREAAARGVLLFGDLPLFVAHDSADVWSHREYFRLAPDGQPLAVAGVPPDGFSATGQRWGNPLYDWQRLAADGFAWWIERVRAELELFDLLRLDHFRGLEAVWEIPADCPTAERGDWRPVPGRDLLKALRAALGPLHLVAEDLGIITPAVNRLRNSFRLPGMKVLQFAFDSDAANPYLPHNHSPGFVVYTGTHDNHTTLGWFNTLDETRRRRVLDYLGNPAEAMPWPLVRAALASVCRLAVIPMQDLLGLDDAHRINTPGTVTGNWRWRLDPAWLDPVLARRLRDLNQRYGRC